MVVLSYEHLVLISELVYDISILIIPERISIGWIYACVPVDIELTDIPRHGGYTEVDSRLLEDASFLRLKNLMLGYSLPNDLLKKTGFIRGLRFYAQAQNLFTFTKFSGLDPEGTSNLYAAQYPMSRQFTFGLDLMF